jgi:hypothetical protein
MATTPINDRDLRLQSTSPRVLQNGSNYVLLKSTSEQFKYGSNSTAVQPASIEVTTVLAGLLSGETPSYTYTGFTTTPTLSSDKLTILPANISGDVATITATISYLGIDYTDVLTISKIYDQITASTDRKLDIVTTDSTGLVYTLPSAANYLKLYSGASVITDGVTYSPASITQNGLTVSVNTTTGQITVSNTSTGSWTSSSENFTLTATKNSVAYTTIYTIAKSKAGVAGTAGQAGPLVDISGLTTFYKNSAGIISPSNVTLSAVTQNVTSPSYSWSVSYGTPSSSSSSSITITPTGTQSYVTVSLTVTGSNISTTTITKTMAIVEQGVVGQTGQAGSMTAFPSIYQWLANGQTPTNPTAGTYTWSTGAYSSVTSSSGTWYTTTPATPGKGYTLYSITIPLTVSGTTTQSTLDWASYTIRAIGITGTDGSTGANGSGTYVITRSSGSGVNTDPSDAEVQAVVKRAKVTGDIVTITDGSNSRVVQWTGSIWAQQTSYITGSLIVENTITGNKIVAGSVSASKFSGGSFQSIDGNFNITMGDALNVAVPETFTTINGIGIQRSNSSSTNTSTFGLTPGLVYEIVDLGNTVWPGYNQYGPTKWFTPSASFTGNGTGVVKKLPGSGIIINDQTILGDISNFFAGFTSYSKYGCAARFYSEAGTYGSGTITNVTSISGTAYKALEIFGTFNGYAIDVTNKGYTAASFYGGGTSTAVIIRNITSSFTNGTGIGLSVAGGSSINPAIDVQNQSGSSYIAIRTTGIIDVTGNIRASGNVIAYYSDDRLKTNLGVIPNALEKLNTLSGFYYEPNELAQQLGYQKRREIGVSAQQVQKILPEIIHSAPINDKYLTIDYERLIPLIIEAIKELDRRTK